MRGHVFPCLVAFLALTLPSCHQPGQSVAHVVFSAAFPSISLEPTTRHGAIHVYGRDRITYGRVEDSSGNIEKIVDANGIEFNKDSEWAQIKWTNIKQVLETVDGVPLGWSSSTEIPVRAGYSGSAEVILCEKGANSVLYFVVAEL